MQITLQYDLSSMTDIRTKFSHYRSLYLSTKKNNQKTIKLQLIGMKLKCFSYSS